MNRKKNIYTPTPLDTTEIDLPQGVGKLIEKMAENAHDVWAKQRMGEGWTFGEKRDDNQKKHPCLIPYNELPESEKEYDRIMAIQSLKVIMKLGYKIEK